MKYTFQVGEPYRRANSTHPEARCGAEIYRNGPQLGVAPYATAHGRTEQIAAYRADRLEAALTATQNMDLDDIRKLAWLADRRDYRPPYGAMCRPNAARSTSTAI